MKCEARNCWRNTAENSPYCKKHLAGSRAASSVTSCNKRKRFYSEAETMFYANRLGSTIGRYIQEQTERPRAQQLSLLEELAVTRELSLSALQMWVKLREATEKNIDNDKLKQMEVAAAELSKNALEHVRIMAESAARIEAMDKEKYTAGALIDVVNQLVRMVQAHFGDDFQKVQEFERFVNSNLRLPKIGIEGTTITPDQDVLDMDATIPAVPTEAEF